MVYDEYFIEIFRDDCRLGSGVRLTRDFALTAAHCLEENELEGRSAVRLSLPDGKQAMGEVQEYDSLSDLALLRLIFHKDEDVQLPGVCFDEAREGELWQATHQLPENGNELRGSVAEIGTLYRSTGDGARVSALRLDCHRVPHDYDRFAGSPVERGDPFRPPVVLGILVKLRPGAGPDPKTVYAGTVREAVRRFGRFRIEGLGREPYPLSVSPYRVEPTEPAENIRIKAAVRDALDRGGYSSAVRLTWKRR
ncbi:trypsin-like peptidase domain-containing protein [Streptomyces sp. NPDC087300]|uniref:trypsin-like peptidase domain-containing protein n=1 Tax=Streptomyces sp. NPDC087300 TaxID=3365780 RepID=UPI0037F5B9B7